MILRAKLTGGKGYLYQDLDPSEMDHGGMEVPPVGYCVGSNDQVVSGQGYNAQGIWGATTPNVPYCASSYVKYVVIALIVWYFFLKGKI